MSRVQVKVSKCVRGSSGAVVDVGKFASQSLVGMLVRHQFSHVSCPANHEFPCFLLVALMIGGEAV